MRQTTTNEKVTRLHATEGSFDEIDGPLSPLTQRSPRDPHYRSSSDSRIYGGRIEEADEEEKDDTDNVGGHGSKTIPMPFSPPRSPLPTTASTSRSRLCSTTSNEDLWMENEQLRQKIEDLREEMKVLRRAYHDRTHLSLPDWKQNNPRVNNNNNNNNSKSSNSSKVLPRDESSGVVVELPRSMRRPLPMHQIFQGSTSSSRNHGATSIPKDHQSLGTCDNDDHSTDERPFIDWDIHKSASGLKKRSLLLLPPKSPKPALRRPQTFSADSISLDEGSFCCSDSGNDHLLDEEEGAGGVSSPSSSADVLVMETRGLLRPLIGGSSREGGGLPISPSSSSNRGWKEENFWSSASDRAGWLVGLLMMQSMSSFILARNEALLQKHLVIVRFLTMLVGAGGNAGNQASVRVIRGLAIGTIDDSNTKTFLGRELIMGTALSLILGTAGFIRAAIFATPFFETVAITTSLFMIVIISIILGAMMPLGMKRLGIDPAHSSTTIQVVMDILGVSITVWVSSLVLDSGLIVRHGQ